MKEDTFPTRPITPLEPIFSNTEERKSLGLRALQPVMPRLRGERLIPNHRESMINERLQRRKCMPPTEFGSVLIVVNFYNLIMIHLFPVCSMKRFLNDLLHHSPTLFKSLALVVRWNGVTLDCDWDVHFADLILPASSVISNHKQTLSFCRLTVLKRNAGTLHLNYHTTVYRFRDPVFSLALQVERWFSD